MAGLVLLVMLAELIKPEAVSRWLEDSTQGAGAVLKKMWMGQRPAWRSPAWQTAALLTVAVLILGQVSKARAQEGGWLASRFAGVANPKTTPSEPYGTPLKGLSVNACSAGLKGALRPFRFGLKTQRNAAGVRGGLGARSPQVEVLPNRVLIP